MTSDNYVNSEQWVLTTKLSSQLREKSVHGGKSLAQRLGNLQPANTSCYAAGHLLWTDLFKEEKKAESRKKGIVHGVMFLWQESNPAETVAGLLSSNAKSTVKSYQELQARIATASKD